MTVFGIPYVLAAMVLAAIFFQLPSAGWRRVALALCNAACLALCLPNLISWLVLVVFLGSGYGVGVALRRWPRRWILAAYLLLFVAAFLICRKYSVLEPLLPARLWRYPIVVVGLSYLLFRQIHFLVDMMQQQIDGSTFASYVNYQLNLFGFLSGPIQRYQDFQKTWSRWEPLLSSRRDVLLAFSRMYWGWIKIGLSTWILEAFLHEKAFFLLDAASQGRGHLRVLAKFAVILYGYPLYLYLNFSGYCDVVIAAAGLVGIDMPENFERPYLSRNMIDFWTRWHRTLGLWIRDYVFFPMYKAVAQRWSRRAAVLVIPCYLVAFIIVGVWHGSAANFLLFGILHGCGAATAKLWEFFLVKRRGRAGMKQYRNCLPPLTYMQRYLLISQ